MRKSVFLSCGIIVVLMAAGEYIVRNSRTHNEIHQNIREEVRMMRESHEEVGQAVEYHKETKLDQRKQNNDDVARKYWVKDDTEGEFLKETGIEVPSLMEVEDNPYIYRYNHELGMEKGLLNKDCLNNHYLNLQAVYRANLDAYLLDVLDLKKLDEELRNSSLGFISHKAEERNLYEKESTMGLTYIYQRNNLYIEYLSDDQISLLRHLLESEEVLVTDESKDMVKETFREVVRVRNPRDWGNESRFLYPESRGRKPKIPSHALVLGIANPILYDGSGKIFPDEYRKEKDRYLDRIKDKKGREYSEILGTEVYILIE